MAKPGRGRPATPSGSGSGSSRSRSRSRSRSTGSDSRSSSRSRSHSRSVSSSSVSRSASSRSRSPPPQRKRSVPHVNIHIARLYGSGYLSSDLIIDIVFQAGVGYVLVQLEIMLRFWIIWREEKLCDCSYNVLDFVYIHIRIHTYTQCFGYFQLPSLGYA